MPVKSEFKAERDAAVVQAADKGYYVFQVFLDDNDIKLPERCPKAKKALLYYMASLSGGKPYDQAPTATNYPVSEDRKALLVTFDGNRRVEVPAALGYFETSEGQLVEAEKKADTAVVNTPLPLQERKPKG